MKKLYHGEDILINKDISYHTHTHIYNIQEIYNSNDELTGKLITFHRVHLPYVFERKAFQ